MLKVLVLGSSGMVGHIITTYLEEKTTYNIFNLSYKNKVNDKTLLLDVTDIGLLDGFLDNNYFDVIINCIGILNQYAEQYKDQAVLLNAYLPNYLQKKFFNSRTKIIHLSTDCVFSGKTGRYKEDCFKDGNSFYDRTKAIGEIMEGRNLTFRTSVIGPDLKKEGIGLFNWFMNSKGLINGYANSIWTGVTTIELSKAVAKAIDEDLAGLYHLVPEKSISKYELLMLVKKIFKREDINIINYQNQPVDKSLINTRRDFSFTVLDYEKMIYEMKKWIIEHRELYTEYVSHIFE